MSPVLQTDPRAGYLAQREAIDAAVGRVLESGRYILGREVEEFENRFAAMIGVAHAIGCGCGTDAIAIALRACGIGAGDLVFTVSHTAGATVSAVVQAGAIPVLIDIAAGEFTIDVQELRRTLDRPPSAGRPAALLPVHLYGQPAAMTEICAIARERGLRVIEDCAQSHGARYRGRATGSWSDFGCFSFYPTKNLGAFGDGGMMVTDDPQLAAAARQIREFGWSTRHVIARAGVNSRLDAVQAAVLGVKLDKLADDNARRQDIAARYDAGLAGLPIVLPPRRPEDEHVYHQYVIRLAERDRLREHLQSRAIRTNIHYPVPVHLNPAYRGLVACGPAGLDATEQAARDILSLPIYPQLGDASVERVIGEIRAFFRAG